MEMISDRDSLNTVVNRLSLSIQEAVGFFISAPVELRDGPQSVKEVLSHLVFWHREYVNILGALLAGRSADLRMGKFRELNEQAYAEFRDRSMAELASLLSGYQEQLEALLMSGFDPRQMMQVKQGSRAWGVLELMDRVEAHIRGHLLRLKTAQRLSSSALAVRE
jgi:hypothetical protein